MNILVLSHEYPPIGGGGANACKYICNSFIEKGNKVTIVTPGFNGDYGKYIKDSLTIHKLNCKRKSVSSSSFIEMYSYLRHAKKLCKKLVKEEIFDITIVFFGIPAGPIANYLYKKNGIPYIVRMGGGDVPGFQKRFKIIYKLLNPFVRNIWNNAEHLIANSSGLKVIAQKFDSNSKINIIYNGVDINEFQYCSKDYKVLNILFVSRLIERKGLQHFLPIFKSLVDLNSDCTLTVCGDGPFRLDLERLVKKYLLEDKVKFIGHVIHEDLIEYYNKANLFVLPSNKEGMPNVVLEAMASGLPILISDCEGSKELVNGNGLVLNFKDKIETLDKIVGNIPRFSEMSKVSRALCENVFNWNNTSNQYIELIKTSIK